MRIHRTFIFALVWCALLPAVSLRGDPLMPILNKTQAMTNAAHDQKLVLLVSGLPSCTDCIQYENLTLQTTNPPMRQFVEEALVYWNCREEPPYSCRDYAPYVTDFGGSFPLPLICVIDPAHPNQYVQRTFGGGSASIALASLRAAVLQATKPRILNLTEGQTLGGADLKVLGGSTYFILQGSSRWTNLPIATAFYRLNDSPSWTSVPVPDLVNWTVSLDASQLRSGPNSSNTFHVYVNNFSNKRSLTNVVNFAYNPDAVPCNPPQVTVLPAATANLAIIVAKSLAQDQAVTLGSAASFAVTATGTAPLAYQWKKNGVALADDIRIQGAHTNALVISNVQTSDQGTYSVVIGNPCFVDLSGTAVGSLTVVSPQLVSQPLLYATNQAQAVSIALNEGKMIMTDFGQTNCSDCTAMTANFNLLAPRIKQWLLASCVIWSSAYDAADAQPYEASLSGFTLPLVCFVDPNNTGTWIGTRSFGLVTPPNLLNLVQGKARTVLPLVVTNLPGEPLTSASDATFIAQGIAQTNATITGAITGVPISAIQCRVVNRAGIPTDWQQATGTTLWSAPVTLSWGTNTLESYVQYEGGLKSWTNRVTLIYLGPDSQTITFGNLPLRTYGDGPFALVATASSGLPVSYRSSSTNVARVSGTNLVIVGAGSAVITASQPGNSAYGPAASVSQTQVVSKVSAIVRADNKSKIYGSAPPPLTFTINGLVSGDTQASAVTGNPALATIANAASGVASYPITVAQGTLSAANYSLSFADGTLAVTPAPLTVTADDKLKTPGTANPPLTSTITGFVNGDTAATAITGSADLSTTATVASTSGAYPITVTQGTLTAANYSFSFVNGTLSIGDNLPPNLAITSHSNLQSVAASKITLTGTASDAGQGDDGIKSVTVNGLSATNGTASSNNVANWSCMISLLAGTNTVKVVARDNASSPNSVTNVIRIISDTARPTLAITSPTAGQRWSNAVFTVTGKASDSRGVAGVWCQTNGVWGSVSTANGWTNWNVAVSLVPGTNIVRAYSQDAAGNLSPTQSVSFVYVLSDRLVVQTNGNGTVNPNYNSRTLEIGQSYLMTATAARGFGFVNWTAGLGGTVVTNKPTLRFVMQSNLVLVANFVDVTRPVVSIVSPGQRVSNTVAPVRVQGRASDNVAVTSVQYQFNGGAWAPAETTSGWTNWTATFVPSAGTNLVKACAVDAAGNRSLTNWVSFFYVVPSPLTLLTNGVGQIMRNFAGNVLEVGRSYTVTAVPGAGQVFSNWVGGITSSSAALSFLMQSNLVLQANIVPNPFLPVKGTYYGLFAENNRDQESSGFFTLALTDKGGYSGSLRQGIKTYSLSGQFDVAGNAVARVLRPGTNAWQLAMALDFAPQELTGTVSNGVSGGWVAGLWANRAVFDARTNPATQYAGKYTLIIPGTTNQDGTVAVGDGYATISVLSNGMATLGGSLADDSPYLSQSVPVSKDGQLPVYASLYSGKGSIWGWQQFDTNRPSAALSGLLSWIKPAQPGARYYSDGLTNNMEAIGLRYTPPVGTTNRVMNLTNGVMIFEGANLAAPLMNEVTLTLSNKFVNNSSNKLTMTLSLPSGTFSGSVQIAGTTRSNSFKGAVLQGDTEGYGYFLGTNQSGRVFLGQQP